MNAIFFDRDGVINRRRMDDYVKSWEEFEFLPEIFEVLPQVHAAGFLAILVTNQRGIGRGMMSADALESIHALMQSELQKRTGHRFDAIYYCPHDTHDGCDCRKPLPGMLLRAAADLRVDLGGSWMVGDSESDIQAGVAAGCRTARVGAGGDRTEAEIAAATLDEAWKRLAGSGDVPPANAEVH